MSSLRRVCRRAACRPGRLDWYTDPPAGCTGCWSRPSSALIWRVRTCASPPHAAAWTTFKVHYRYRQTVYHITITRLAPDSPDGLLLALDGQELAGDLIPLRDDRNEHAVEFRIRDRSASTVALASAR